MKTFELFMLALFLSPVLWIGYGLIQHGSIIGGLFMIGFVVFFLTLVHTEERVKKQLQQKKGK